MKIIIIGKGQSVYHLSRHFTTQGHKVVVICDDKEQSRFLSHQLDATILFGKGTEFQTLQEAGAESADVLLSLTSRDHDNLVACQVAEHLFAIPRAIALVNNPENEEVFLKLGIHLIFAATRIISCLLQEQTNFMAVTRLMAVAQGQVDIAHLQLSADAAAAGKSLQELTPPEGVVVAIIIRGDEVIVPRGSTVLKGYDQLVVIGRAEHYEQFLRMLT